VAVASCSAEPTHWWSGRIGRTPKACASPPSSSDRVEALGGTKGAGTSFGTRLGSVRQMTSANEAGGTTEFGGCVVLVHRCCRAGIGRRSHVGSPVAERASSSPTFIIVAAKLVTEAVANDYPDTEVFGCTLDVGDRGAIDSVVER